MKKTMKQKVCDVLPIGVRMTVGQLCDATQASRNTMTQVITELVHAKVLKPVDTVALPNGGRARVYSRVMDLPAAQKRGPARQSSAWRPPVKFASVFHYARGASL